VASGGDLSGDGFPDLAILVSEPQVDSCLVEEGEWALRVVTGPLNPGSFDPDDAAIHLRPPAHASAAASPQLGDWDGDGQVDILYLGIDYSIPGYWWPVTVLYSGPLTSSSKPAARLAAAGTPVATGDFDGDGLLDLFQVGATGVVAGPLDVWPAGYGTTCTVNMTERWDDSDFFDAEKVAWVGDLDSDGLADVVMASGWTSDQGLAWVVLSSE